MSETETERLERLRAQNIEDLRRAGHFLIVNEKLAIQILMQECGAPDEDHARYGVGMAVRLLAGMARSVRQVEALKEHKPPLNS